MELRFSVLARNREFAEAMRRIQTRFTPLVEAFATTQLVNPIHQAILVGNTDDKGPELFEEVPNRDGFPLLISLTRKRLCSAKGYRLRVNGVEKGRGGEGLGR